MGGQKKYSGYKAYSYLEPEKDYEAIEYRDPTPKEWAYTYPLSKEEDARFKGFMEKNVIVDLHEHPVLSPKDMTREYNNQGRERLAYDALARSGIDAVFDNMMDGSCYITSKHGGKWTDVIQNLGMRLCDLSHQDYVIHCRSVEDIYHAWRNGKLAWVGVLETLDCVENEVDRLDVLYGLGVRQAGITYSESNMLGSGLKEHGDSGLTDFGYDCVARMNKVGMLIDVSHCSDKTAFDTIVMSEKPLIVSHCGSRTLTPTPRMLPDDVIRELVDRGGVFGVEMAGAVISTKKHPVADLEAYMEQTEYCIKTFGIDHVGWGPDTMYGDHIQLYKVGAARNNTKGMGHTKRPGAPQHEFLGMALNLDALPPYVKGMENPTESIPNAIRWMIKHGYSDPEIAKVAGLNAINVLKKVWK
jgi:membrane dipeptidase